MKIPVLLLSLLFIMSSCYAAEDVLNYKVKADSIQITPFNDVSCKFEQEKLLPNSNQSIKSYGNFQFILKKGVIFETQYPIKYTTSYTSKENKYVNDIIIAISKKNFSYIEKNFEIFFQKQDLKWVMGLIPKKETFASTQLKNIIIFGGKDIDRIVIDTINNGSTKLKFTQCK